VPVHLWHWQAVASSWRLLIVPNVRSSPFAVERRLSPLAAKRFRWPVPAPARLWNWQAEASSWRLPIVPNVRWSLFAVDHRLSPLAAKRFWWPVPANLWLSSLGV
jgi:hypothetical protein